MLIPVTQCFLSEILESPEAWQTNSLPLMSSLSPASNPTGTTGNEFDVIDVPEEELIRHSPTSLYRFFGLLQTVESTL